MNALIVEDDKLLMASICDSIKNIFKYECAYDGEEGLYKAKQNIYDVIVLDIMLPGLDGYSVLKELRSSSISTPVLILTSKDSIEDKVKGFRLGGDDYLVKPFHTEELLARLIALVRRKGTLISEDILMFHNLELNIKNRSVHINGKEVSLKGRLFDLLEYLISNRDTILTREQIFSRIWGFDSDTTVNVVEVYASNLRKALKEYGYDKYIKTIRGLGYMLASNEEGNV